MGRALRLVIVITALAMLMTPLASALETENTTTNPQEEQSSLDNHLDLSIDNGKLIETEENGESVVDLGTDFKVNSFAWDPAGEYVIIVGNQGLVIKLTVDGQITHIPSGTTKDLRYISWKPVVIGSGNDDDSYALILGVDGLVQKWDGKTIIHIMENNKADLNNLEWSDNGDYAIIQSKDGKVFRYPPEVETTPFISIKYPLDGAEIDSRVLIKGVSSDPDGMIIRAEVRIDYGEWISADGTKDWSYDLDVTKVQNGHHTIQARAYDGTIFSTPVTIEVEVKNDLRPTIEILSPLNGSIVPQNFIIQGTAFDPEDKLEDVWVRIDNGIWFLANGLDKWMFEVDLKKPSSNGIHIFTVRASDGRLDSKSEFVILDVRDLINEPDVEIDSPYGGKEYGSSEEILFKASVIDFDYGDLTYTWESNIDGEIGNEQEFSIGLSIGDHKITVAVSDGIREATAIVTIEVFDDNDEKPTVRFLTPREGKTVSGVWDVRGGAEDDNEVFAIMFRVDSNKPRTMAGGSFWKVAWDTTDLHNGKHVLTASAYDGKYWSEPVSIMVYVNNAEDESDLPFIKPDNRLKDTGGPSTGELDEVTTTAIAAASFIAILLTIIGVVESYKVKFLSITFVPLYSRIKKEKVLDNFTRGAIYGFIVANPGAHYNLIKQELKLNNGAIIYHLDILERKGFIHSEKAGIYKRYFQEGVKQEGGILAKLTDIQKRIFIEIKGSPGVSQKEIASKLNITARALNYHIKTMMKSQLIKLERVGRRTLCFINNALQRFEPSGTGA